jgi:hypothetical protein
MNGSPVTTHRLACLECDAESDAEARGWKAYRREAYDGEEAAIGIFCADCADREFGVD